MLVAIATAVILIVPCIALAVVNWADRRPLTSPTHRALVALERLAGFDPE